MARIARNANEEGGGGKDNLHITRGKPEILFRGAKIKVYDTLDLKSTSV